MATAQRSPRDIIGEADAEYQRLAEQHRQYEAKLQEITHSPYHCSEDLIEEIQLKKMKLHVKDEMERLAARVHSARARHSQ
ncbi:MAG TPA: YdcH family protein [Candidatus Eisenbacteria bacterium]|nr:YdcH family protein [Candidatus Eisenbacteria bacterium]